MKMKLWHKIIPVLLLCVAAAWLPVPAAQAEEISSSTAGSDEPDTLVSLTIAYEKDGIPLPGVHVSLYRAGELNESGTPVLTGDFAEYPVDLGSLGNTAQWDSAALTLAGYAAADSLPCDASSDSSPSGEATVSGLEAGIYLVTADTMEYQNGIWHFDPFLILLPQQDNDGNLLYHVTIIPKGISNIPQPGEKKYEVRKHWAGKENASHPARVDIDILKDGKWYASCTLSEENNWSWSWTDTGESEWQVVERNVADNYTVTTAQSGNTWIVTNTFAEDKKSPPAYSAGSKLPQTGQLLWPIPVLTVCGMLLFAAGWSVYQKNEKKKN